MEADDSMDQDRPYIESLRLRNYGCVRDATFKLGRLHALIGPNDSGKSTVLRALRTLAFYARGAKPNDIGEIEAVQLAQFMYLCAGAGEVALEAQCGEASWSLGLRGRSEGFVETTRLGRSSLAGNDLYRMDVTQVSPQVWRLREAVLGSHLLRLDPDAMRQPGKLVLENAPLRFGDPRGAGLPGVYDAILKRDTQAYLSIGQQLSELFPSVQQLQLTNPAADTTALAVKLQNGTVVKAEFLSEGILYFLAYAALDYLDHAALLLVEEPENGLHPTRIAEVMRVLRKASDKSQVVLATHSPLVINELGGEEVSVVTRMPDNGTRVTLLKDTQTFEQRSKVYANGELWVSYADGKREAPLFEREVAE